jgi:O-antigen/teichoic acid export membrane protein
MISELHSSGRLKELEHFYKTTTRWSFSFTLPISLLMILMSQQILQLYGKEFLAGASSLILVCVDGIIASAVGSFDYMIIMSGHSMVELYGTVGTQAMIIISGFFAIPKYGVFGAAFSFTVSVIFATLIMLLVLYYILRIHPYECGYVKPVVASGTASLSFIGLTLITPVRYPYNLIICSIAFLLIYFGLLWSMGLTHEETELLRSFKRAFIWTEAIRR